MLKGIRTELNDDILQALPSRDRGPVFVLLTADVVPAEEMAR